VLNKTISLTSVASWVVSFSAADLMTYIYSYSSATHISHIGQSSQPISIAEREITAKMSEI